MATLDVALYCYPGSLYSSIARLGLAEKHVRYEERLVDIGPAMRSYAPQYMRINPRGVVPTLEVRGERITDATRIIAWVDEHLPGPPLTPADPSEAQRMREWMDRADAIPCRELSYGSLPGPMRPLARYVVQPRRMRLLRRYRARNPELAERYDARLRDVEQWTATILDPAAMDALWAQVNGTLDDLEDRLEAQRYVAGSCFSLADVLWTPILARLRMLGLDEGFGSRRAVAAYYARMRARPSFREAEVAERVPAGKVARLLAGFLLPRLLVAAALVTALIWALVKAVQ
ncbi:MAG: glutathione S-transferase family protein [Myxococcales bacterium]|nr:glutathione S-transferase family protein [Myxococcales bacterium]MCB9715883.1 glutathione S-transferase family protein [Myxococcales bacterium]